MNFKQVIVVRSDVKMGKGKLSVQVAHAAVAAAEESRKKNPRWYRNWVDEDQAKIAVKVDSERMLMKIKRLCEENGLPVVLIRDRGLTQIEPGTATCIGIGPAPSAQIDKITGRLKLL